MRDILRIVEKPNLDNLSEALRERFGDDFAKNGAVEDYSFRLDEDGYHIILARMLWTRNRRTRDHRGSPIQSNVVMRFTAQEATALVHQLAIALMHADATGPKKEES